MGHSFRGLNLGPLDPSPTRCGGTVHYWGRSGEEPSSFPGIQEAVTEIKRKGTGPKIIFKSKLPVVT